MRVTEKLTFAEYWQDGRFAKKQPDWDSKVELERCGDNIYEPLEGGGFRQLPSKHWDDARRAEDLEKKASDTKVDAVLVSDDFVYYGGQGPPLPDELGFLAVGRGHRSRFTPEQVETVIDHLETPQRGRRGDPALMRSDRPCGPRKPAPTC